MRNVTILVVSPRPQMRNVRGEALLRSLRADAHLAVEQVRTAALYTIRSPRSVEELELARRALFTDAVVEESRWNQRPLCRAGGSCRSPCCPG